VNDDCLWVLDGSSKSGFSDSELISAFLGLLFFGLEVDIENIYNYYNELLELFP